MIDRIAGLGAGVDAVEDLRLLVEVVAVGLEMLIPVGKLDDHFHLGVDGARGRQNQVAGNLIHELEAEGGPAQASPLAAMSESRLVLLKKKSSSMISSKWRAVSSAIVLHVVALFGIGVAHRDELAFAGIRFIGAGSVAGADVGDASRNLDAVGVEEGFHGLQHRLVGDGPAAIGLDVDLVDGIWLEISFHDFSRYAGSFILSTTKTGM